MDEIGNPLSKNSINKLRYTVYGYYGIGMLSKTIHKHSDGLIQHVVYCPVVRDAKTLADLINRVSWYFPQTQASSVKIYIPVVRSLLGIDIDSLPTPSSQHRYIGESNNINLIELNSLDLSGSDIIMLWNKKEKTNLSILKNSHKVHIVDPTYYFSVEAETYQRMYYKILDPTEKKYYHNLSINNFQNLLAKIKQYKKAYVFGSGPTLEQYGKKFDYDDGFRIVCNSIVKNKDLMLHINPHVLVFGDAQHHASPCLYAATFRDTVLEALDYSDFYIVTEDYFAPLLLAHYPELERRIIGIEAPGVWDLSLSEVMRMVALRPHKIPWFDKIPGHDESFNFPTTERFYVRRAGSVLPSYMIPLASTACDDIYILGADGRDPNGRKPDETYIWSYSKTCQFSDDLMQTAFNTHPAYFRDRPYTEVMDIYSDNYEELLQFGENCGKKYYSLTPSFIPPLSKRYVKKDQADGGNEM